MIHDVERYHGVVLRALVVEAAKPLTVEARDSAGRVNTFFINERVLIHIKHSSKRLPPWQFTFTAEQLGELAAAKAVTERVWLVLVCGGDGLTTLPVREFEGLIRDAGVAFLRVDRAPHKWYRITGSAKGVAESKPQGVAAVVREALGLSAMSGPP